MPFQPLMQSPACDQEGGGQRLWALGILFIKWEKLARKFYLLFYGNPHSADVQAEDGKKCENDCFQSTSVKLVEYLLFSKKQRGKIVYFRNVNSPTHQLYKKME